MNVHSMGKYGARMVTVTQSMNDLVEAAARRRKIAAFEEWRQKLRSGDRLPRGKFFKGKKPGFKKLFQRDEFWLIPKDEFWSN
ncbi:hypothetical protein [Pseudomonas syringae]|uniref:hypothetical protein n=1 Tax=Pseudomonas syringae TaxID=317 RepID=UPI00273F3EDD|nr:hypothetical protein [Pseudomonas syringae]MDP5168537.1 hypothetical protein [Pseudomonas syringae pv. aptata str. DSM 50252]